jgi:DNA invertase Pin-like site-specific DNA recombinase
MTVQPLVNYNRIEPTDASPLLALPFGDFSGALYQPFIAYSVSYRHTAAQRTLPWIRSMNRDTFPMTTEETVRWLKEKHNVHANGKEIVRWEEAALNWVRPIGTTAWPYIRVSERRSSFSGISLETQRAEIVRYYARRFTDGTIGMGPVFSDPSVSASKTEFRHRRGGMALSLLIRPGDHILFARLDRGLRSVYDASVCWHEYWQPKNITPHFLDLGIDLTTAHGQLVFNIMVAVAQSESDIKSERMKGIVKTMKENHRPMAYAPLGWKKQGQGKNARLVKDEPTRVIMREIYRLREEEHKSFWQISDIIEQRICQFAGRLYTKSAWQPRLWNYKRCEKAWFRWGEILRDEYLRVPASEKPPAIEGS